ncbi:MAG TPA: endonuclease domain-containing protein [Chitinophagales bacterium]|nr:endonuclease domain-containing protein [Chitinophagales bacterium]
MSFNPITRLCRELRKNETAQEKRLWGELKNRNFFGVKFRRQHPFTYLSGVGKSSFFVADFYCAEKKLLIELDGRIHDFQKDYDTHRDAILLSLGLTTIRLANDEIDKDVETALNKIAVAISKE